MKNFSFIRTILIGVAVLIGAHVAPAQTNALRERSGNGAPANPCSVSVGYSDTYVDRATGDHYNCKSPDGNPTLNGSWIKNGTGGGAGTGEVIGPASSTDGEMVLFSGTTGKSIKRSNGITGIVKVTAGVATAAVAGNDYVPPSITVNGHALATNVTVTAADVGAPATSRLISTTSPITGGGDLSADRTIACATCGVTGLGLNQFAATTSAQFFGVISDESGSGSILGGTAPTIAGGTHTAITSLGIRSTGSGAFDLTIANTENLTAGRTLTVKVNDAARTLDLAGNLATSGANGLTLTTTAPTNVTLPASGTLLNNSRLINTTSPITGGGDLSADRTLACATCVVNNAGNTFTTTGGIDLSASTNSNGFKVPVGGGITVTANGAVAFDSTNNNFKGGAASADSVLPTVTVTPASGNCVQWSVAAGRIKLADAGAACAGGTSGGGWLGYSASSLSLAGTQYFPVVGGGPPSATETDVQAEAPSGATLSNFYAKLSAAPGAGNTVTITFRNNVTDQSVTCAISGASATDCRDITHSFTPAAQDKLDLKVVTSGTVVGTLALSTLFQTGTTSGNGVVNSGTANQLAYYASTGTSVSGLTSANNRVLLTSGAGVPSWGTVSANLSVNSSSLDTVQGIQTTSNPQFANLGLNVAASTSGGQINATGGANNITLLTLKRNTDTSPTGNFEDFKNAAAASLWTVDITGSLTAGSIPVARLSSSTITLNAGTNFGVTAPGAMTLGNTFTIGATTDNLRFNDLGLNVASPTSGGQISATGGANNITLLTLKRNTDTSPTGNFQDFQNAAAASLWTVDITGSLTAGSIPNARLVSSGALTVNTSSPLGGGGSVSLGGTLTLTCATCAVTGSSNTFTASQTLKVDSAGAVSTALHVSNLGSGTGTGGSLDFPLSGFTGGQIATDYNLAGCDCGTMRFYASTRTGSLTELLQLRSSASPQVKVLGDLTITGALAKGSGTFRIDHPLDPLNRTLYHGFVEAPRYDLMYRGRVQFNSQKTANVAIDPASNMTTGTFATLTQNAQVFIQNESGFTPCGGSVSGGSITITCQLSNSDSIGWLVVAERHDTFIRATETTDSDGHLIPEWDKKGDGVSGDKGQLIQLDAPSKLTDKKKKEGKP